MTKPRTNTLEALRALISERQQYEQWISTLKEKRSASSEQVFNRVYADYRSRLERVVEQVRSHAEELQVSIKEVSDRLHEVARDEEAKRDSIQEAELRAAVGEYDAKQWESMRADASAELEKIATNRSGLESQLSELESIRKLSEVSVPSDDPGAPEKTPLPEQTEAERATALPIASTEKSDGRSTETQAEQGPEWRRAFDAGWPQRDVGDAFAPTAASPSGAPVATTAPGPSEAEPSTAQTAVTGRRDEKKPAEKSAISGGATAPPGSGNSARKSTPTVAEPLVSSTDPTVASPRPSAIPVAPPPAPAPPPRRRRDTPVGKDSQISSGFSRPVQTPADGRPEVNKTLKCPECGTPNYPTEWYCERCGGELATM